MKRIAAAFLVLSLLSPGCTGSFKMTQALHQLHREQKNKWLDELLFILAIPAYGVAFISDAVYFNAKEFWTGQNPVDTMGGGYGQVSFKYGLDGTIEVIPKDPEIQPFLLARTPEGVVMMDLSRKVLAISRADECGGVTVLDGNHKVLHHFAPREVERSHKYQQINE